MSTTGLYRLASGTTSAAAEKAVAACLDPIDAALTSSVDYSNLDVVDPSRADGFEVVFDQEVQCEVRAGNNESDPHGIGAAPEPLQIRVLVLGDSLLPERVRVEITCEHNLFFYYVHELNQAEFFLVKDTQKLTCDWAGYSGVLLRLLALSAKEPNYFAIFIKQTPTTHGRLWFIQNMEHKFVELLSANFSPVPEEHVRRQLDFRYKALKSRLAVVQTCLADVYAVIKLRNPSLLRQLQAIPQRLPGDNMALQTTAKPIRLSATGL